MADAIAPLATKPYSRSAWWTEAGGIAARLKGTSPSRVAALFVHPPPRQSAVPWSEWLHGVQAATAMVLAHSKEGRLVLEDVIRGPVDWTAGVSAIALAEAVRDERKERTRVFDLFVEILRTPPSHGAWFVRLPVVVAAMRLAVTEEWKKVLEEQLANMM